MTTKDNSITPTHLKCQYFKLQFLFTKRYVQMFAAKKVDKYLNKLQLKKQLHPIRSGTYR